MPGVGISVRNTRHPEVMAGGYGGLGFVTDLRARGFSVTKPPHPAQAGLLPEPGGSREVEALGHARLSACPGLPGPGPHGPLRVNSGR